MLKQKVALLEKENANLKEQLKKLFEAIDEEMRAKNEITEKMMTLQQEMDVANSMLEKESDRSPSPPKYRPLDAPTRQRHLQLWASRQAADERRLWSGPAEASTGPRHLLHHHSTPRLVPARRPHFYRPL